MPSGPEEDGQGDLSSLSFAAATPEGTQLPARFVQLFSFQEPLPSLRRFPDAVHSFLPEKCTYQNSARKIAIKLVYKPVLATFARALTDRAIHEILPASCVID